MLIYEHIAAEKPCNWTENKHYRIAIMTSKTMDFNCLMNDLLEFNMKKTNTLNILLINTMNMHIH